MDTDFVSTTKKTPVKEILIDVVKFIIAMGVGVMLDFILFQFNNLVNPTEVTKQTRYYIVLIGSLQIILNLIIITIMKRFNFGGALSVMGLFIPQSIVLKKLYKKSYAELANIA